MSSTLDKIPFYLDERYKSEDLNALEDVAGAWLDDYGAFESRARATTGDSAAAFPLDDLDLVVLAGLNASPSGSNISIATGLAVCADLGAQTERPISQRMLARNPAPFVITMPAPVTDTWYLVFATVQQLPDAPVSRDIWDEGAQAWVPTSVEKRIRQTLAFNVVAGSATQIPASAQQLPLCAVFRPAGGGAVDPSHLVDLRPFRATSRQRDGRTAYLRNLWRTTQFATSVVSSVVIDSNVIAPDGSQMWIQGTFDPEDAAFVDPASSAPSAGEWWYLYLCPFPMGGSRRVQPRHAYASGIDTHQGLLVVSQALPDGRTNDETVELPAPFTNYVIDPGRAVCIGALKRSAFAWVGAHCVGDLVRVPQTANLIAPNLVTTILTPGGTDGFDMAPVNARAVSYKFLAFDDHTNVSPSYAQYQIDAASIGSGSKLDLALVAQAGGYTDASDEVIVPQAGLYSIQARAALQVAGDTTPDLELSMSLEINAVEVARTSGFRYTADDSIYTMLHLEGVFLIATAGHHVRLKNVAAETISLANVGLSRLYLARIANADTKIDYTLAAGQTLAVLSFPQDHTFHTLYAADLPLSYGSVLTITKAASANVPELLAICEAYRI